MRNSVVAAASILLSASVVLLPRVALSEEGQRAPGEEKPWVTVAGGDFTVQMPSSPRREVRETSSFLGAVETVEYRCVRGEETFFVNRVDLPGLATFFLSDESLLERVRDEYIKQGSATETSYRDVTRDGQQGKALDFKRKTKEGRHEEGYAEFFIADGKLFTFTGLIKRGQDPAAVKHYLSTVDFKLD